MLKSHDKFHSANGKRRILIVDDELINREILRAVLEQDYEILQASDGEEALDLIRRNRATISLVLLDLLMPKIGGLEVLRIMKAEEMLRNIPVIVLTADQDAEIESLSLGAIDFIPKPYPRADVIIARIVRTIELSEDREIINSTERDPLTRLYQREFFYRYAEQYDIFHSDEIMDAVMIDINHFHLINERCGRECGDGVLRRLGAALLDLVAEEKGCIACRGEADAFYIYLSHREDYGALFERISSQLNDDPALGNTRARIRMGVYSSVDKKIEVEHRFDRAKKAADTIRNDYTQSIAIYDSAFHEAELYREQLAEDFWEAIREKQFVVYYQPKFDIRGESPVLSSAEALVRWMHPRLGMVSPGVFIPLFENNGMIRELDRYVWREAARQIREWRDRFGVSLPVSVNVSRIDMYDPSLADIFHGLMEEFGISPQEYLLEITESAYADDSEIIISAAEKLRDLGLRIEMDDFGTGYSSLSMLSNLPIDILKLDMIFVRNAFGERRDLKMLELIISIAEHLNVPVIAEGVETGEQVRVLRRMGCDYVQGFYFSRPLPPDEFERYLREKSDGGIEPPSFPEEEADDIKASNAEAQGIGEASWCVAGGSSFAHHPAHDPERLKEFAELIKRNVTWTDIALTLAGDYFGLYCVETETERFVEIRADERFRKLGIEQSGEDFFMMSRRNARRVVYSEDRDIFLSLFTRENVLQEIETAGSFSMSYRLVMDGTPNYVSIKARCMEAEGRSLIIAGISNVDVQMRREQELVRVRVAANRDELTGVKSRLAFQDAEKAWNERIIQEDGVHFAIMAFELSSLADLNESLGRKAGDSFIRDISALICATFKRSPVFRIGGDDFAVIMSDSDYEKRDELARSMENANRERAQAEEPTFAFGMAEYTATRDSSFASVFAEACREMRKSRITG